MINFVFEDLEKYRNFIDYTDIQGPVRYQSSAMVGSLMNQRIYSTVDHALDISTDLEHCIISTGVGESPNWWAGADYFKDNIRESLFDNLTPIMLQKLKAKKALLLIDQCLEGYQTPWLWQFIHEECNRLAIDPAAIVYVTGNLIAADQYNMWVSTRKTNKIKVIPYAHFERDIQHIAERSNLLPTYAANKDYKQRNITSVKTYNCLNKRPRTHRNWFYLQLYKEQLLEQGLVSMNDYGTHIDRLDNKSVDYELMRNARGRLPLMVYNTPNNDKGDLFYINRITDQIFLDSWVTIISEASFADSDETIFISEKTFKPIACMHPFIFLGNRYSLDKLRDMGYRTFDGFINESYDKLSTFDRMAAIITEMKRIIAIKDKMAWFDSMKDILEHNYKVFHASRDKSNIAHTTLDTYYKEYFNIKE